MLTSMHLVSAQASFGRVTEVMAWRLCDCCSSELLIELCCFKRGLQVLLCGSGPVGLLVNQER